MNENDHSEVIISSCYCAETVHIVLCNEFLLKNQTKLESVNSFPNQKCGQTNEKHFKSEQKETIFFFSIQILNLADFSEVREKSERIFFFVQGFNEIKKYKIIFQ